MDKVKKYQHIITDYLREFSHFGQPPAGLEHQVLADTANNHFQMLTVGWQNERRFVYLIGLHMDIKDGKIWIWQNNTDAMVADELQERGVPKSDIVLAFHAPQERKLTGFAVA
jgi:hypothetical protein